MMAAAARHEYDLVLFWSLDRFSREGVLATLQYLQTLTSYGVGWRSFTEQYLDSCGVFRDAVLSILATIAKQERIRISERTIAGLAEAAGLRDPGEFALSWHILMKGSIVQAGEGDVEAAKRAHADGTTVAQAALALGLITAAELSVYLDPSKLACRGRL